MTCLRHDDGVCFQNSTDDEEHDSHSHGGNEQRNFAPKSLDEKEHEKCGRDDFHDAVDSRSQERIGRPRVPNLKLLTRKQKTL